MQSRWAVLIIRAAALAMMTMSTAASAAFVTVYGGPERAENYRYPFLSAAWDSSCGYREKWIDGMYCGSRALRWDDLDTAPTQLGDFGNISSGITEYEAYAVSNAGNTVGCMWAYDASGQCLLTRAVWWRADGSVVDLNTLVDPASGWTLTSCEGISDTGWKALIDPAVDWSLTDCEGISDTGWVCGFGVFDPDGGGPQIANSRPFILNISSVLPEPAGLSLLAAAAGFTTLRRRCGTTKLQLK